MTDEKTLFLIEWLEALAEGRVEWPKGSWGLCDAIYRITGRTWNPETNLHRWWIEEFEHYSGDYTYPLPGGHDAYTSHRHNPLAGEHGQYRLKYAQHIANYLRLTVGMEIEE